MKLALLAPALLAALMPAPAPVQAQSSTIIPVWVQNDESKETGQGVFLRSDGGCFLYTAAHVLVNQGDRADLVNYRIRGGAAFFGKVRWTPAEPEAEFDIGAIEAPQGAMPEACPNLQPAAKIDKALNSGTGEILLIGQGGDRRRVPVRIVRLEPNVIVRPLSEQDQIQQGDSGAPLLAEGIVVGLISKVENKGSESQITVIRLDAAPPRARPWFAPSTALEDAPVSLADANQILSLARESRPDADIGQVAAIETLNRSGKALSGLDLAAISLAGAKLPKVAARNTDFTLSNLAGSDLTNGDLSGALLHFANLAQGDFRSAGFDRSYGIFFDAETADFSVANLTGVAWRGAVLANAKFQRATLDGASITFTDLRNADFRGATFNDLILIGSDLRGAKFDQGTARSIDVTGALFDDATFPAALKPKLCGTLAIDNVRLYVWETYSATIRSDSDYSDLGKQAGGEIPLRVRADRYFPPCPQRTDSWRAAMIQGTKIEDKSEIVDTRIGVSLPSSLIKGGGRRQRILQAVTAAVARGKQRETLLDASNTFYRDRPERLLRHIRAGLAAAGPKSPIWLNELIFETLALNFKLKPAEKIDLARSRFAEERNVSKFYTVPLRANENWSAIFPPDFAVQDLNPQIRDIWTQWGRSALPRLPLEVRIAIGDRSLANWTYELKVTQSSVGDIIYPYDSAFDATNRDIRWKRAADCIYAVNPPYDPARKAAAQKRLNYYGRSEMDCQRGGDLSADKSAVFGGNWYVGKAFVDVALANDDIWIVALDRAPPPSSVGNDGVLRPGTISGRLTKVMKLPEHTQCPLGAPYLEPKKCRYKGYLIVLENVRFAAN